MLMKIFLSEFPVANFTRHIKDVHDISRAEYSANYGNSEVVSKMFKCELCDKEIKHTRNIIGAHMKMVHLISWKEYQEILSRVRQGKSVGELPIPELFVCDICGVSVKYKREHLHNKHQITEAVYDELATRKSRGEDIAPDLPERTVFRCIICDRDCLDLKKHIEKTHQITEDMYEEMAASKKEISLALTSTTTTCKPAASPSQTSDALESYKEEKKTAGNRPKSLVSSEFSASAQSSPTELLCYFGCEETFRKGYQLYLHLKLQHMNEPESEMKKATEAAEEEIALTRRSGSVFKCALCPRQFNDNGAFYGHIQVKHSMQWKDYRDKYGRCEVESKPFECKICLKVIKYDRNTVHAHLKYVHGINWEIYLERIRKLRRGEVPDDLPIIEMTECKVCNVNVKYLKEHLKNAHKIDEFQYKTLFKDELDQSGNIESNTLLPKPHQSSADESEHTKQSALHSSTYLPKPRKSDITDKSNKVCSSCSISFESRKSFISHCSTKHGMKFKTKPTGVFISSQNQQNERKRSSENADQAADEDSDAKMARLSPHNQTHAVSPDDIELPSSTSDLVPLHEAPQYSSGGVSKWNQCKYECYFCQKTSMSRSSMTSHIQNLHKIPILEYKKQKYPDIEVVTNWFPCRLCGARVKFVKDCISPHLRVSHSLGIKEYEEKFMQPEDWPQAQIDSSGSSENGLMLAPQVSLEVFEELPQLTRSPDSRLKREKLEIVEEEEMDFSETAMTVVSPIEERFKGKENKWNKCKYQCYLCSFGCLDSRQMRNHVSNIHGISYDEYQKSYGSAEVVTVRFRCELCNSEMKHCRQNIYAHMKDVHKMTLADYEDRVGLPDPEDDLPAAGNGNHSDEPAEEILSVSPIPIQFEQEQITEQQPAVQPSAGSKWNRCRFQCFICQKTSNEKRHIRDHIVKVHAISMVEYESQYGNCEVYTEYFFCGVCHAEVKHNLKNISLHLQNVHKLSTKDYEETYGGITRQFSDGLQESEGLQEEEEETLEFSPSDEGIEVQPEFGSVPEELYSPSREDVFNTKCKYCRPCDKEFSRRQVFLDHCRNVHGMKLAPRETVGGGRQSGGVAASSNRYGSHPCPHCGKVFSNRSNRNRHMSSSCDVVRARKASQEDSFANNDAVQEEGLDDNDGGIDLNGFNNSAIAGSDGEEEESEVTKGVESKPSHSTPRKQQLSGIDDIKKCPFPTCKFRNDPPSSPVMQRHLNECHQIHDVSVSMPDFELAKRSLSAKNRSLLSEESRKVVATARINEKMCQKNSRMNTKNDALHENSDEGVISVLDESGCLDDNPLSEEDFQFASQKQVVKKEDQIKFTL